MFSLLKPFSTSLFRLELNSVFTITNIEEKSTNTVAIKILLLKERISVQKSFPTDVISNLQVLYASKRANTFVG